MNLFMFGELKWFFLIFSEMCITRMALMQFSLALTPALSPRERENHLPLLELKWPRGFQISLWKLFQQMVIATAAIEDSMRVNRVHPLLGERAGVRACIHLNSPFLGKGKEILK
jgi:hypothetical protein